MRVYASATLVAIVFGVSVLARTFDRPQENHARVPQVLLIHHTTADQGVDAEETDLEDCSTQRNLSPKGRVEARKIGASLRQLGVVVGKVMASPFCRTVEPPRS